MQCPFNIYSTGLGLFSRVSIESGCDIGYYGGELVEEWGSGKPKTHARRAGDGQVYDGWNLQSFLRPSGRRAESGQVEYRLDEETPTNLTDLFVTGVGFMMNTSVAKANHNVAIVPQYLRSATAQVLQPALLVLRTTKRVAPGDELRSKYQSNFKVNSINKFLKKVDRSIFIYSSRARSFVIISVSALDVRLFSMFKTFIVDISDRTSLQVPRLKLT